jgi:hypothetical protein
MSKQETIDITPDPSLMEDIGSASYTLYQAINELLANTFDARPSDSRGNPVSLNVDIKVQPGKLVEISDDAKGMDRKTFEYALTLGFKMDRLSTSTKTRKGMYGLGMKTAAASLGAVWEIWTRSNDDKSDYYAKFDLEEFKSRWKGGAANKWKLSITTLDRSAKSPLGSRTNGTVIRITDVRDSDPDLEVLEEKIGTAYRVEIDELKDVVSINGEKITTSNPLVAQESRQEIAFTVKVGSKEHKVKGWWARLNKYNNDGSYGFTLYRERQLIETNVKKPFFNPHNTISNFYGELHLDFIKANFHKKGFAVESPEYKALVQVMVKMIMPPILSQVRKFKASSAKRSVNIAGAAQGAAMAVATAPAAGAPGLAPLPLMDPAGTPASTSGVAPVASSEGGEDWKRIRFRDVDPFALTYELAAISSEDIPWYMMEPDEEKTLIVRINTDSLLYSKTKDPQMFAMFAVADCLCTYLRKIHPKKDIEADLLRLRDAWLNKAVTMKFSDLSAQPA